MKYEEAAKLWAQKQFPDAEILGVSFYIEPDSNCCPTCGPSPSIEVSIRYSQGGKRQLFQENYAIEEILQGLFEVSEA